MAAPTPVGSFALVLHSHLPYYRKAGMWPFGEENLYEAIAETYLPLLNAFNELRDEGVAAKVTIGITPVLAEQLADEHLKRGFETYVEDILERIVKDQHRYSDAGLLEQAAWEKGERIAAARAAYEARKAASAKAEAAVPERTTATPAEPAPDAEAAATTKAKGKKGAKATRLAEPATGKTKAVKGPKGTAAAKTAKTAKAAAEPAPTATTDEDETLRTELAAIEAEFAQPRPVDPRRELADFYHDWYAARLKDFREVYQRDVLRAFKSLQDQGCIEIITSAATHGFSPLLSRDSSLNAQFKVGVQTYEKYFGRHPQGVWLPECAYRPGIDTETEFRPPIDHFLAENGLHYFFTESHAVMGGKTKGYRRLIGPYGAIEYVPMPERELTGLTTFQGYWLPENPVAVYARNETAGMQVWAVDGYPGDPWYREFHKRDGNSGMQYWRVTGKNWDLAHKDFYNPQMAMQRVHENSDHYVGLIYDLLANYHAESGEEGVVVVPFDTELFGHWWFEGIEWIKQMIRKMAQGSGIRRATVSELLAQKEPELAYQLPESTWGAGGHFHVWMNPEVEFMWPIIHRCEQRMEALVRDIPQPRTDLEKRALAQAARELLLLEGSDWPFLVTTGQAKRYAMDRFNEHVERFDQLADAILAGTLTEKLVASIEDIDNAFGDIDYHVFADRQERASVAS